MILILFLVLTAIAQYDDGLHGLLFFDIREVILIFIIFGILQVDHRLESLELLVKAEFHLTVIEYLQPGVIAAQCVGLVEEVDLRSVYYGLCVVLVLVLHHDHVIAAFKWQFNNFIDVQHLKVPHWRLAMLFIFQDAVIQVPGLQI